MKSNYCYYLDTLDRRVVFEISKERKEYDFVGYYLSESLTSEVKENHTTKALMVFRDEDKEYKMLVELNFINGKVWYIENIDPLYEGWKIVEIW